MQPAASEGRASSITSSARPSRVPFEVLDRRAIRMAQRSRPLLITVLEQTEELLATKPANAPNVPIILRRIAEDCVELEHLSAREGDDATVAQARAHAIATYETLLRDHADAITDEAEVLYDLAIEYQAAQDLEHARSAYKKVIDTAAPTSPYASRAYLALGETFFDAAGADATAWPAAEAAYDKALLADDLSVRAAAALELGRARLQTGRAAPGFASFGQARAIATQAPELPGMRALGRAAEDELVAAYAKQQLTVADAYAALHAVSGDAAEGSEKTCAVLRDLSARFDADGRKIEAIALRSCPPPK
jgi:tetratricopeptide (TPR) repeat protein